MTLWQHLYIAPANSSANTSTTALYELLQQQIPDTLESASFKRYDPFGLMPATRAYAQVIRLFIAPPDDHPRWLKLITSPDSALPDALPALLSQDDRLCLIAAIEDQQTASIRVYQGGRPVEDWNAALKPLLQQSPAANVLPLPSSPTGSDALSAIPTEGMPDDLRAMADKLSGKQMQKLMNRMSGQLLNAQQQQDAQHLLAGTQIDWSQAGGQQITRLMEALHIPHWRTPDYVALRDAYQLQSRLKRNPNARLYPGDQEAMDAVPDALRYIPIYAGSTDSAGT